MCRRTFRCTTAHQCSSERAWIDTRTECSSHYSSGGLALTLFVSHIYPWSAQPHREYIYIYIYICSQNDIV